TWVQGQPSRFLSSGHSGVPPGGIGSGAIDPSSRHIIGGGSCAQNASGLGVGGSIATGVVVVIMSELPKASPAAPPLPEAAPAVPLPPLPDCPPPCGAEPLPPLPPPPPPQ